MASVTTCKTIVYVIDALSDVVISTPIALYNWFNKSRIRHFKKHLNKSNGSEKIPIIFAQARNPVITNETVNLENTVVNTPSWNTNLEQNALLLIIQTKI